MPAPLGRRCANAARQRRPRAHGAQAHFDARAGLDGRARRPATLRQLKQQPAGADAGYGWAKRPAPGGTVAWAK
jgi:hypothetical protein